MSEYRPVTVAANTHTILKMLSAEYSISMAELIRRLAGHMVLGQTEYVSRVLATGAIVMATVDRLEQQGDLPTIEYEINAVREQVISDREFYRELK